MHQFRGSREWSPWVTLLLASLWLPSTACGPSADSAGSDRSSGERGRTAALRTSPIVAPRDGDRFVDVTREAGLEFSHQLLDGEMTNIVESLGSGAAFFDFDGDGWLDLYFMQSGWVAGVVEGDRPARIPENRLYRNRRDGTFEDVTATSGTGDTGFGIAVIAGDYDGDGHQDLYLCNMGPNRLLRNRGDGTFEDVTERAGVGDPRLSVAAAFFDYDGDSRLDLYVANYLEFDPKYQFHYAPDGFPPPLAYEAQSDALFRNLGDGTFEDVSSEAGIDNPTGRGMSLVTADLNADGLLDIFVTNDASANFLWRNTGQGRFVEAALECGVAYGENGEATAAMTADLGDYDRDGQFDLMVTDMSYGSLYRQTEPGWFVDQIGPSGVAPLSGQYVSWGGGFLDYDNDADLDLLIVNGDLHHLLGWEDLLLENTGAGRYADASDASAYFGQKLMGRGGLIADYDNDGDLDLLVTNLMDRPALIRNDSNRENAWITLTLSDSSTNRAGLGSRVTITHGEHTQVGVVRCPSVYLCSSDPRLHFGLGQSQRINSLEVVWPDGERQTLSDVPVNQLLTISRERT